MRRRCLGPTFPVLLPAAARFARSRRRRTRARARRTAAAPLQHGCSAGRCFSSAAASPRRRPAPTSRRSWRRSGNGRRCCCAASLFNLAISFLAMAIGTIFGMFLGFAQISLLRPVQKGAWFATHFFRNAPWLVLLFYCMFLLPFQVHAVRRHDSAAGLDQGDARPVAAGDGQRVRDRARRDAVDPDRAMGVRRLARLQPPADAVDDHPAAVRQAHAAAVDEPVCDPDDGDGAGVDRRRAGSDDADRRGAELREPAGSAAAVLQLRAVLVFPLLLSDRALDRASGSANTRSTSENADAGKPTPTPIHRRCRRRPQIVRQRRGAERRIDGRPERRRRLHHRARPARASRRCFAASTVSCRSTAAAFASPISTFTSL